MGQFGILSADYEICDYGQMKYRTRGTDRGAFEQINKDIRERFGASHIVRVGAEIKPVSSISIRAGYGLATSSEKVNSWGEEMPVTLTQNISFGAGYSSRKSFFADIAVRRTILADEYYMPYSDYIYDDDGNIGTYSPELLISSRLWKVFLTFGWRF